MLLQIYNNLLTFTNITLYLYKTLSDEHKF